MVTILVPGRGHWEILRNLLLAHGTGGSLTTDAHIAALALEYGCRIFQLTMTSRDFPA